MYVLYKVVPLNMNIVNIPYYVFTEYKKERRWGQDTTRYLSTINFVFETLRVSLSYGN
jgi:hypothetical protein